MSKKQTLERAIDNNLSSFNFDLQLFAPDPNDLLIGAGKVLFRRWENGEKTVFMHLGNCPEFKLAPNIEKVTKYSSMDSAKEVYAEAIKSMGYTPSITLDEYNPFNLALGLYGEQGIEVQETKAVTKEIHTVKLGALISVPYKNITDVTISPVTTTPAEVGNATSYVQSGEAGKATVTSGGNYTGSDNGAYYIEITKANTVEGTITDAEFTWRKGMAGTPSEAVVVTGSAQSIAEGVTVKFTAASSGQDLVVGEVYEIKVKAAGGSYISGVDYILDKSMLRGGIISIPKTSNIPDGSKVFVSYTVPTAKYPKVMGGTVKKIEGDLMFIGDPKHGRPYVLEIWHVNLTPNGDVGLITEEWGSFTIEMTVLADRVNHPDEPFFKMTDVA